MPTKFLLSVIAMLIGAILQQWLHLLRPLIDLFRKTMTFDSALAIILALLLACLISIALNLILWSARRRPLGEQYRFEDKRGYNVDKKGRPLCPACLIAGHVTRLAMRPPDIGYCNACGNTSKGNL